MVGTVSGRSVTLRRRGVAVGGVAAVALGLIGTTYLLLMPGPDATLSGRLQLVAAMIPILWFVWLVGPHPRVRIYDDRIVVVNLFMRVTAPLSSIDFVDVSDGAVVTLVNGQKIKPIITVPALVDRWRKHDMQQGFKDALDTARAAAPKKSSVGLQIKRRLDVVIAFPLTFGLCLAAVAWLASR